MTQKKSTLVVCKTGIYKDLPVFENISLACAALCDSCQKPFMKKSKITDLDNLPLETMDDDENSDYELLKNQENQKSI